MFIGTSPYKLESFGKLDFLAMNGSKATNPNRAAYELNSANFVLFNLIENKKY